MTEIIGKWSMLQTLTYIYSQGHKDLVNWIIYYTGRPSNWFGSADCDTNKLSYYPSVHKMLIRTIFEAHIVCIYKGNFLVWLPPPLRPWKQSKLATLHFLQQQKVSHIFCEECKESQSSVYRQNLNVFYIFNILISKFPSLLKQVMLSTGEKVTQLFYDLN